MHRAKLSHPIRHIILDVRPITQISICLVWDSLPSTIATTTTTNNQSSESTSHFFIIHFFPLSVRFKKKKNWSVRNN